MFDPPPGSPNRLNFLKSPFIRPISPKKVGFRRAVTNHLLGRRGAISIAHGETLIDVQSSDVRWTAVDVSAERVKGEKGGVVGSDGSRAMKAPQKQGAGKVQNASSEATPTEPSNILMFVCPPRPGSSP